MEQKIVKIGSAELAAKLYGAFDANMKLVEAAFAVTVHNRPDVSGSGEVLTVSGSNSECVDAAARAIETLARMGERSETLADLLSKFDFWMGEGMQKYAECEAELPFDSHFLKAMVAPRTLFVSEAVHDIWANPIGSWQTTLAAGEAFKLLGAEDQLY